MPCVDLTPVGMLPLPVPVLLGILLSRTVSVSSYRHIHFTNADACDPTGKTKTLHIGEGALILSLNNDSFASLDTQNTEKKICNLMVKSRKGMGLMVYAEKIFLRSEQRNGSAPNCVDYVEFGREDIVPFITLERSGRLCGERTGFAFDEPEGQLLIWLRLGPRLGPLPSRASVTTARLSLVITPYSSLPRPPLTQCAANNYWVRRTYFCDGRVNCPLDVGPPRDEADSSCATTAAPAVDSTSPTPSPAQPSHPGPEQATAWDFSFVLIVPISMVGLLVIACGIVCTLKRCTPLGRGGDGAGEDQGPGQGQGFLLCPDSRAPMLELAHLPSRAVENSYEVRAAVPAPRPASPVPPPTTSVRMPKQSPLAGRSGLDAPPPSYHEIFPPDYVPDPRVMAGTAAAATAEPEDSG